jgi:hypothetical protein
MWPPRISFSCWSWAAPSPMNASWSTWPMLVKTKRTFSPARTSTESGE